jgi:hypothetical protein
LTRWISDTEIAGIAGVRQPRLPRNIAETAYRFTCDPEVNCVFVRHFGEISPSDIDARLAEMFARDVHRPGMNNLRDLLDASFSDQFNYAYFKERAAADFAPNDRRLGKCRVAWVLPSRQEFIGAHQMKLVHLFQVSKVQRKEFFDLETAKAWLEIAVDYEIKLPDSAGDGEIADC